MFGFSIKTAVQIRNGKWKEFNKHAILIAEGYYLNNKKHGIWREYYDHDGSLMIEEVYSHGIPHGSFASYHPNGQLLSIGEFKNGSREGIFKVYDENGTNIRNIAYFRDQEIEDIILQESSAGTTA
jgi:antitoxin component YwqK of YwqJK toxin-antitoxin module